MSRSSVRRNGALCGDAAELDLGAKTVTAGFAQPGVADAAFAGERRALRHELLVAARGAERAGKIAGETDHRGRSIVWRHVRPPVTFGITFLP